jgi:DNA polymerase/3'-5' exonuclease PolX
MTTATAESVTREEVLSKTEHVEELVRDGVDARPKAKKTRSKRRLEWYRRVEDGVLDLFSVLGRAPEVEASYEMTQLFTFITELRHAIEADPDANDARGEVELTAKKMLDVVKRLERHVQHSILDYPDDAARYIFEHLDALDVTAQARLLGVSTKTVGAWKRGEPVKRNKDRVILLAQLLTYLRHSMTQTGVKLWFENTVDRLGGQAPLELLEMGTAEASEQLIAFARGGRGQLAG